MNIVLSFVWTALIIIFAIIEGMTMGLTSIWFAIGALVALLASAIKLPFWVQLLVFSLTSILMIIYTRPVAKKVLKIGENKTNIDSLIGKKGIVLKEINDYQTGQVKVKGQIWTAKNAASGPLHEGDEVEIIAVEGVKLIVKLWLHDM